MRPEAARLRERGLSSNKCPNGEVGGGQGLTMDLCYSRCWVPGPPQVQWEEADWEMFAQDGALYGDIPMEAEGGTLQMFFLTRS